MAIPENDSEVRMENKWLFDDQSDKNIFLDANERRLHRGMSVRRKNNGQSGRVIYCRFGYPVELGFSTNWLPLAMIEWDDKSALTCEEISTTALEIIENSVLEMR